MFSLGMFLLSPPYSPLVFAGAWGFCCWVGLGGKNPGIRNLVRFCNFFWEGGGGYCCSFKSLSVWGFQGLRVDCAPLGGVGKMAATRILHLTQSRVLSGSIEFQIFLRSSVPCCCR